MKKIIALLCLAVLVAALLIPTCVCAKQSCPICDKGGLVSINYSEWVNKHGNPYIQYGTYWVRDSWKERTVTVKCTKATHKYVEKKDFVTNPYSWVQGWFE